MTAHLTRPTTGLAVFSDPASVAVVGASADPAKWGYWLASGALKGSHRRHVSFVNSRSASVLGHPCATSISALQDVPDLVALCVPAGHVDTVVDEALDRGVRGFLGITAGVCDDAALARRITARGGRLIGTNSLGIYDATTELQLMWGSPTPGPLAIVSQSGQLGSELAAVGRRHGLGVSRFVSVGNQSDVTATELLADLAGHDATRVVALYLEGFADGESLFATLSALRASGKPTVLLTVGASAASSRLARTHTGSLTSSLDVVDAACRAAGVIRVDTPGDVVDVARTLLAAPMPRGHRVAIVGDSGGQSAIAADVASAAGLTVPPFPAALTEELTAMLPAGAACSNPVDLAGAGEQDLQNYAGFVEHVIADGEVDAVVMTGYFGCYGLDTPSLADAEAAIAERLGTVVSATGVPVLVHTMAPDSLTAKTLGRHGVPTFDRIESVMRALSAIGHAATELRPAASGVVSSTAPVAPGYWAARAVLAEAGVAFPRGVQVRTAAEVAHAARCLDAPFVLKAGWLEHKSEVGGVRTNLRNAEQLSVAFDDMRSRLGEGDYVVEQQDTRADAVEILVAARRDAQLGAMVVVGAGGTETEIHQDIRLECAPVSRGTAASMLDGLRCAPLLHGWRGRPPVDADALADLVVAVSHLIAQRSDIAEIELNPVRVTAEGVLAVDGLIMGDSAI
ncbi:acetate--CoA ligase family protein [Mycolicibacterium sp.]|uniref:acetate--CoA ligase family protein n=1 Tax=Mycolicibacterium sp. TaxID=2320850 RepID=UPI001A23FCDD|nr:acetate--CoA ligase family protein [Mycolicibacterium sp.]MBJ7339324.1 acetate--CoA ligase family protein [Mycolicibacterium sp.]